MLDLKAQSSPDTLYLTDFGAVPDSRTNATPYVLEALKACKNRGNVLLLFPKGRYDFWPQHCTERVYFESNTTDINPKRLAILVDQMKEFTLDGMGSEFVFHDRMQPLTIDQSSHILARNFSIDWDIPLTAQAEILSVTDTSIDIRCNPCESPCQVENDKLVFTDEGWKSEWNGVMEFDRLTRLIPQETGDASCLGESWQNYRAEDLGSGLFRLHYPFKRKPATGNFLVLRHSNRDHAGIFITGSDHIRLENIRVYHTAGLGILSQYSDDLQFSGVDVIPNPAKNRYLSGHDDGMHFSNCGGHIAIDHCTFAGLMDDPVNVHGTSVRVMEVLPGNRCLCKFMHHQSVGMEWARPGDRAGFIENESMITYSEAVIKSFTRQSDELFILEFSGTLPQQLEAGDALENLSRAPSVHIRDCRFKSCRARGMLVSTPGRVIIEHNEFESSGSAILIAGDANYWYESGAVQDVLIRDNRFLDPCLTSMYQFCEAIISICPEIPGPDPARPFHRNIRITGNSFHPFDYPVLFARSVDGLTFSGNKLIRSTRFQPFHHRKAGITLESCMNVLITGNQGSDDVLGKQVETRDMKISAVQLDKRDFFKLAR